LIIGIGIETIVEPSWLDPDPDPDSDPEPEKSQRPKAWRRLGPTRQLLLHCTQDLTHLQASGAPKEVCAADRSVAELACAVPTPAKAAH
jgi:hypothetical protein